MNQTRDRLDVMVRRSCILESIGWPIESARDSQSARQQNRTVCAIPMRACVKSSRCYDGAQIVNHPFRMRSFRTRHVNHQKREIPS